MYVVVVLTDVQGQYSAKSMMASTSSSGRFEAEAKKMASLTSRTSLLERLCGDDMLFWLLFIRGRPNAEIVVAIELYKYWPNAAICRFRVCDCGCSVDVDLMLLHIEYLTRI